MEIVFVRVVHRQGWDVELIEQERKRNFPSRAEALAFAESQQPDWIELGVVVHAAGPLPQHHQWTTLRRQPDGRYAESGLSWGGRRG
jgi:hypothetical protein